MSERVLLINPPESGRGDYSTPPLGILYIASYLKKNGIDAAIVDGYLAGWKGIEEKIEEYRPTIVGITCHTYSRVKALKVARMAKERIPDVSVVMGGAHPTIMYKQLLESYPFVDIAVRGEGEKTFLEICQRKPLNETDGIAYRQGHSIAVNSERKLIDNLDELPLPQWDLIDLSKYPSDGSGIYNGIDLSKEPCVSVVFSRGCIGQCIFCCDKVLWKRWRRRSAVNMVEELELLHKKFGVKRITFNDDLFTASQKAAIEVCNEIVRRGINIAFEITSRVDTLNLELLTALKRAGCFKICFGIESAAPELLVNMKKEADVVTAEEAIRLAKSVGIKTSALLIAGNIGETKNTINQTIDFLNRANPDEIGLANGLRILPGTGLYEHAKKLNFINDTFWLSEYNWKIFTAENSKLRLNIFHEALRKHEKLSSNIILELIKYHRYYWKALEDGAKSLMESAGLHRKKKRGKYEVAY